MGGPSKTRGEPLSHGEGMHATRYPCSMYTWCVRACVHIGRVSPTPTTTRSKLITVGRGVPAPVLAHLQASTMSSGANFERPSIHTPSAKIERGTAQFDRGWMVFTRPKIQ
jgi:hypothetical protein